MLTFKSSCYSTSTEPAQIPKGCRTNCRYPLHPSRVKWPANMKALRSLANSQGGAVRCRLTWSPGLLFFIERYPPPVVPLASQRGDSEFDRLMRSG
jgi:hypothetical protein